MAGTRSSTNEPRNTLACGRDAAILLVCKLLILQISGLLSTHTHPGQVRSCVANGSRNIWTKDLPRRT